MFMGAAVLLALSVAACGKKSEGGGQAAPPAAGNPTGSSGGDIDLVNVDACVLLTEAELQTFFGEPAGAKETNNTGYIRGCAMDNASRTSYVFVSVQAPPTGSRAQYDFDRSQTKNPEPVSGVGEAAFSWYDDDEAEVTALHGSVLVHVSKQLYSSSDTLKDPTGTVQRLTVLAKQAVGRV
jgi:hypothetical protein